MKGTRTLVDALRKVENPPKIFVSASAIGFYGSRGDEVLTEESAKGKGFFPEVCEEWEAEGKKAEDFGARVVMPRIGVVLAKTAARWKKCSRHLNSAQAEQIGSGDQWMSWIAIDDLIRIIHFALENENVSGAVNATAPNPVTNKEFTDTLGNVLHRPTIIPDSGFWNQTFIRRNGRNTSA